MTRSQNEPIHANIPLTPSRTVHKIGFWSAILTTVWIVLFDIAIALGMVGVSTRSGAVGVSLLLSLSFIVLIASIHHCASPEKQVWSHIGLAFAIVYASLLTWNYYLQITVVRHSPQLYEWLTMDFTPATAFWSLETAGYTLMGLAALFASLTLNERGIGRKIRWCLGVNAVFTATGCLGYILYGNPLHGLVLASLGVWAIAFPIATVLTAVMFKRMERMIVQ